MQGNSILLDFKACYTFAFVAAPGIVSPELVTDGQVFRFGASVTIKFIYRSARIMSDR